MSFDNKELIQLLAKWDCSRESWIKPSEASVFYRCYGSLLYQLGEYEKERSISEADFKIYQDAVKKFFSYNGYHTPIDDVNPDKNYQYTPGNIKNLKSPLEFGKKAQPEFNNREAYKKAYNWAKGTGCDVIYGYFGTDHRGNSRYYSINYVVCEPGKLDLGIKYVMKKYHPKGSLLTAYHDGPEPVEESFCNKLKESEAKQERKLTYEAANEAANKLLAENPHIIDLFKDKDYGYNCVYDIEYDLADFDIDKDFYRYPDGTETYPVSYFGPYEYTVIPKLTEILYFLDKTDLTQEDVNNFDDDEFYIFLKDLYFPEAEEEANEAAENDDIPEDNMDLGPAVEDSLDDYDDYDFDECYASYDEALEDGTDLGPNGFVELTPEQEAEFDRLDKQGRLTADEIWKIITNK